jgi:hypothetical protein
MDVWNPHDFYDHGLWRFDKNHVSFHILSVYTRNKQMINELNPNTKKNR